MTTHFKIDLHVHSWHSGDNDADPEETVARAIELGLHGIAFTEHYFYAASEPAERLREKFRDTIMIFRGVEFSAEEGHCLVFGVDTDKLKLKYAPFADVVRAVGEAGGVVIPSHPYRGVKSLGDLITRVPGICGVEGYNGANMHAMNAKAIETAGRLSLPYTGGSDAHMPREVGSCYTEFDGPVTYDNFIACLRAGRYHGVDTRKVSRFALPSEPPSLW
jgi:predicted metal-dependent phosphoesterase TrpH